MKDKSNANKIKKLEVQYFRYEGNEKMQKNIMGKIKALEEKK